MNEPQAAANPRVYPPSGVLDEALALVEFLRSRCPWDAEQTHHSLRRYLLEEAHEVVDAIDDSNDDALCDELGDLLLNLAFQIVVAEERAAFNRSEVVRGLQEKMRRRHPQIYGSSESVSWEVLKAAERGETVSDAPHLLRDLVQGRDALAHAYRVQARVATIGFDWANADGAWEKVREEVDEVRDELSSGSAARLEEEVGDLIFAVVNFARLAGVHPTTALTRANAKFARRFGRLETLAAARDIELGAAGLTVLESLWTDVKREEAP